jgi:hypothetical protein
MTEGKTTMWYGALGFWLVVACLVAARIILFDPSKLHQGYATSASDTPSFAGQTNERVAASEDQAVRERAKDLPR